MGGTAYLLTGVAQDWGMKPSEFGVCGADMDIAVMIAYSQAKNLMSAYQAQLQEAEMEKKRMLSGGKA